MSTFYDSVGPGRIKPAPGGASYPRLKGYCPMGCGQTLFAATEGHITCSLLGCPDPTAVDTILEDREHEHVVVIEAATFSVQHPLGERVAGQLFDCDLHQWMSDLPGPPARPGRYRARAGTEPGPAWRFEHLEVRDDPADPIGAGPGAERRCRVCLCTEENACEGSCGWTASELCSVCAPQGECSVCPRPAVKEVGRLKLCDVIDFIHSTAVNADRLAAAAAEGEAR